MFRKIAFVAVVGLAGAAVLTQTKLGSYLLTFFGKAEDKFNDSVPADWELERIRNEVRRLDNDIEETKGQLAKARVEARTLGDEIAALRGEVEKNEADLLTRGEAIKAASQGDKVRWKGRTVTVGEAKQELLAEVARHKNRRDELKAKEKTLEIRERNRDLLARQIQALVQQKSELATAVDKLEAEINLARLEQVESRYQNDGSRMAGVKKSLKDLEKRVAVQREGLNVAREYDAGVDAAGKSVDEILADLKAERGPAKSAE